MVVAGGLGSTKDRAVKVRTTRTCNNPICNKNPYFGWHGEKAVFCVSHKTVGMVDVKNKRCEEDECMKRGLFGYDGERARFCGTHRLQGMVDLKNKRCKWVGCAKQANFAEEGLTTASFCLEHRTPGMVDVKGHRCITENCNKVADYGVEGGRPTSCLLHRKTGMVDMKQHRPRRPRLPATRKPNGINVKLSGGMDGGRSLSERFAGRGAGSGGTSSLPSRGTGSKKGVVAGKSLNTDSNLMLLPPVSRLDPCPDLDLLRPATYPHLSSSGGGGGNSSHPQEHWLSDPAASSNQFGGGNSGNSNGNGNKPSADQPLRSWRQGGCGKSAISDSSVPTVSGWAFNGPAGDGSGNGNGNGNGGAHQLSSPQYAPSSHHQESSIPPSAASMRGSASLPALNRFGSGSAGGGYFGERSGIDGGGWRSPALSESLQLSAVSAAIEQPGYGDLSALGIGRDAGMMSVVKTEQEAIASGELHMPEPESADAWLRDLMHGAIMRENNNAASQQHQHQQHQQHQNQHQSQQHQQHPIYSSGVVLGTNSNHHMRNPSNSQQMKQESRGPSYHASQHQQHQQSPQGQGSVLSLSNVSRMKGGAVTTRTEPTTSVSTVAGRSPSAGSSGASPPDEPENFNDPAPQGSYQHDLARAGGGGGNHGLASMVNLRAGARGAAGPPNHLFTTHLPGISGGGCDRGYGTAGFTSDVNFPPLARVASPTAWGGF